MGYYQEFIKKEEEAKIERLRKNARKYYWMNRDKILEKRKENKLYTNEYYKNWYNKNRVEVNIRRGHPLVNYSYPIGQPIERSSSGTN